MAFHHNLGSKMSRSVTLARESQTLDAQPEQSRGHELDLQLIAQNRSHSATGSTNV